MNLLKRIFSMFSSTQRVEEGTYWIYARCNRCGEALSSRVNLYNDISLDYEEETPVYFCRKLLIGEARCFQPIEVWLRFDQNRRLINSEINGGRFITAEEYRQARASA